jgi:hypothetical protein
MNRHLFLNISNEIWEIVVKKTLWPESESKLYRPSDRRLPAKLVPTFADSGCHVVGVTDPYGRILGVRERSRYFSLRVAPHLYSRGWVDPVPDPLLLGKSSSAGNWTRASGSVAKTTEAVTSLVVMNKNVQVSIVLMDKLYSENAVLVLSTVVTLAHIDRLVGLEFTGKSQHYTHTEKHKYHHKMKQFCVHNGFYIKLSKFTQSFPLFTFIWNKNEVHWKK